MADHSGLDNDSGFDGSIEAHKREMLAAPTAMGFGKNAAHLPYFGVEMAAQGGFAMMAQAAARSLTIGRGTCGMRAAGVPGRGSRGKHADK
jgi:hypothetical protein